MEPTQLGPYRIRSRLGRGGMGTVYEAEDAAGHVVAVKTLSAHLGDDAAGRRRFAAEIEALKALRHPGIVRILAWGEEAGEPFFAMELVRGTSLEQSLRSGRRFSWRETVGIAIEIARALKSAHDHGVVHRDLKPANLLLLDEPTDGCTVKLADFGIARLFGDNAQTQVGMVVGTAEYMAPEQATGGVIDHRADLYALGLVMFAMLDGRPPFHGGPVPRLLERQRLEKPPRLAACVAGVPAELDELVDRLLAKDPARRPASALAVGRLLAAIETIHVERAASAETMAFTAAEPPPRLARGGDAPQPIDHFAETRAGAPAPATAQPDPVTEAESRAAARRPTVPDVAGPAVSGLGRSRFTTMEELDRETRRILERDRRRHVFGQAAAALATIAIVAGAAWALFRRHTADELHARITTIASDPEADLRDARPLIETFLTRHPHDRRAAAIRDLDRTLDLDALERRARRRPRAGRPLAPIERDYRDAMERAAESPAAGEAALEAILAVHAAENARTGRPPADPGGSVADDDEGLWLELVRRQLGTLAPLAARERAEDEARAAASLAEAADLAAAAGKADGERASLLRRRVRELLEGVVAIYAPRPHAAAAVAEARRRLGADVPQPSSPTTPGAPSP